MKIMISTDLNEYYFRSRDTYLQTLPKVKVNNTDARIVHGHAYVVMASTNWRAGTMLITADNRLTYFQYVVIFIDVREGRVELFTCNWRNAKLKLMI